ncbi:MAG TPA: OsmC family protein [Gaiellaceae bacterium]
MSARPRIFSYAASVDEAGRTAAEAGQPLELGDEWSPEHLTLAALVRCTLTSLRYHARRAGIDMAASGKATGTVTRREDDGRYAFVDFAVEITAELDPAPADLGELLAMAERDCFVGASLTTKPSYTWLVNGNRIASVP